MTQSIALEQFVCVTRNDLYIDNYLLRVTRSRGGSEVSTAAFDVTGAPMLRAARLQKPRQLLDF